MLDQSCKCIALVHLIKRKWNVSSGALLGLIIRNPKDASHDSFDI